MAYATRPNALNAAHSGATWNVSLSGLGHQAGDVLILVTTIGDDIDVNTSPAGWTLVQEAMTSTASTGALWYKVATGSETTATIVWNAGESGASRVECWRHASGLRVIATLRHTVTGTNHNCLPLTAGVGQKTFIAARAAWGGVASAGPSGYTGFVTTGNSLATAYLETTNEVENPGAFTNGSATGVVWTLCLIPVDSDLADQAFRVSARDFAKHGGWVTTDNTQIVVRLDHLSILSGDLLLMFVASPSDPDPVPGTPAGWEKIGNIGAGGNLRGSVYKRTADGTETSVTVSYNTAQQASARIEVWRNAGDPTLTGLATSGTNVNPPSHTAAATSKHVWLAAYQTDGTVVPSAAPTNYGQLAVVGGSGNWGEGLSGGITATAHRTVAGSITEDPGAFTNASTTGAVVWTIAIPKGGPAGGGGRGSSKGSRAGGAAARRRRRMSDEWRRD